MPTTNNRKLGLVLLSALLVVLVVPGAVLGILRATRLPHEVLKIQVRSPDEKTIAVAYVGDDIQSTVVRIGLKDGGNWASESVFVVKVSPKSNQIGVRPVWLDSQHLQVVCTHCDTVTLGRGSNRWHNVEISFYRELPSGSLEEVSLKELRD